MGKKNRINRQTHSPKPPAPNSTNSPVAPTQKEVLWNVPNVLTLSRLPMAAMLFYFLEYNQYLYCFVLFLVASVTDWLDGWWARKFNQGTAFGRAFDPLIDKVLTNGAFIFLIPKELAAMQPWMVAVIVGRELLVTGIRGYLESIGKKFGADWFGKLKMFLQCVYLGAAFFYLAFASESWIGPIKIIYHGLLYAMLAATVLSGLQYFSKAYSILTRD